MSRAKGCLLAAALAVTSVQAQAASIGKEAWSPEAFWSEQIIEIPRTVESQRLIFRMNQIERERGQAEDAFIGREMRAMGIQPTYEPEMERLSAETDGYLRQLDLSMLHDAEKWGERCLQYARQRLSGAK